MAEEIKTLRDTDTSKMKWIPANADKYDRAVRRLGAKATEKEVKELYVKMGGAVVGETETYLGHEEHLIPKADKKLKEAAKKKKNVKKTK